MRQDDGSISLDGYFPFESLAILRQSLLRLVVFIFLILVLSLCRLRLISPYSLLESVVSLLEERHMSIEFLHVECAIEVYESVHTDGIAERSAVFEVGASLPIIRRLILDISCYPVENRDKIERQLIRRRHALLIIERST